MLDPARTVIAPRDSEYEECLVILKCCDIYLSHEICNLKDTSEYTLPEGTKQRSSQAGIILVGTVSRPPKGRCRAEGHSHPLIDRAARG